MISLLTTLHLGLFYPKDQSTWEFVFQLLHRYAWVAYSQVTRGYTISFYLRIKYSVL